MNIMTERDFLLETQLDNDSLNQFLANGLITPIQISDNKHIYVKKHKLLVEQIAQAIESGFTPEQIQPFVSNNQLDLQSLVEENNIEGSASIIYESLTTKELRSAAREENITGYRRMTRDELLSCLIDESSREEIISNVRERNRRNVEPVEEVIPEPEVILTENPYGQFMFDIFNEEVEEARSEETRTITEVSLEEHNDEPIPQVEEPDELSEPEVVVTSNLVHEDTPHTENQRDEDSSPDEDTPLERDQLPTSDEVPYSYEQLIGMTSKQIAVIVRDHIDVLYFRRMTKEELMTCIFYPERRDEMVRNASERYDRYRNRQ